MSHAVWGGIFSHNRKDAAGAKPVEILPPPDQIIIPMSMHPGPPCRPCVSAGEYVTVGQQIGTATAPAAAPVHTPAAGRVAAVEPRVHPGGESVLSVVIKNDFSNALCPAVRPPENLQNLSKKDIVALIYHGGVVNMNGDCFPAYTKIISTMGKVDTVIVDACESEPNVTCNYCLLLEKPEEVLGGVRVLARLYDADRVHIAIENNKMDTVKMLRQKIEEQKEPAVVDILPVRYPQSAEVQLCREVAGRRVPPGADSADVGCAVFDAAAAAAIYEAVCLGKPLTHRIVAVSGSGVPEPKNLLCPIGTPVRFLLDACGGVDPNTFKIVMGGPMTGQVQYDMDVPVVKGTSAVLAFCRKDERVSVQPACIRCGRCIDVCPAGLRPLFLYQYEQAGRLAALKKARVMDCIECGACSYVCPGRVPLMQAFRTGKQKIRSAEAAAADQKETGA